MPEPKVGKNRVHVDFTTEDREAEVARLVELGATVSYDQVGVVPGLDWTTLADPEGNVFCVGEPHAAG
jgi:predicted enzyme related to lactoylglutathione lyase